MGRFEIIEAVECGDLEAVRGEVRGDPSLVDAADTDANPLLYWAAVKGHEDITRFLLDEGADADRANADGQTPLAMAAAWGQVEIARLLIEKGARVNAASVNGFTPLHNAADRGRDEVIELLLSAGADPNQKKQDGWTPLHTAAYFGRLGAVKLLLANGADLGIRSDNGAPRELAETGLSADGEVTEFLDSYSTSSDARQAASGGDGGPDRKSWWQFWK